MQIEGLAEVGIAQLGNAGGGRHDPEPFGVGVAGGLEHGGARVGIVLDRCRGELSSARHELANVRVAALHGFPPVTGGAGEKQDADLQAGVTGRGFEQAPDGAAPCLRIVDDDQERALAVQKLLQDPGQEPRIIHAPVQEPRLPVAAAHTFDQCDRQPCLAEAACTVKQEHPLCGLVLAPGAQTFEIGLPRRVEGNDCVFGPQQDAVGTDAAENTSPALQQQVRFVSPEGGDGRVRQGCDPVTLFQEGPENGALEAGELFGIAQKGSVRPPKDVPQQRLLSVVEPDETARMTFEQPLHDPIGIEVQGREPVHIRRVVLEDRMQRTLDCGEPFALRPILGAQRVRNLRGELAHIPRWVREQPRQQMLGGRSPEMDGAGADQPADCLPPNEFEDHGLWPSAPDRRRIACDRAGYNAGAERVSPAGGWWPGAGAARRPRRRPHRR